MRRIVISGSRGLVCILIVIVALGFCGCTWSPPAKPSFLIVAVDNLSSDSLDCSTADIRSADYSSGLASLCANGVRFTHAYTTSILSQPALASILTGLYPIEDHVRQNGDDYLSDKFDTVADAALRAGYRTAFLSGGAPIWRKSGFTKGFELFDDDVIPTANLLYRPFSQTLRDFFHWVDSGSKSRPFFAVMYVPDLQFAPSLGEAKRTNIDDVEDPQLQLFTATLSQLVNRLKKRHLWRTTNIALVGLNGVPDEDRGELDTLDLYSENSRIFFLFKSAHKDRHRGNSWPIDANVSLADLGTTLFDLLHSQGTQVRSFSENAIQTVSLRNALKNPNVDWANHRLIPIESAWAKWRNAGRIRYAFRVGNVLYINDRSPKIYNSLTDRFEVQPLSIKNPSIQKTVAKIQKFITANKIRAFDPLAQTLQDKLMIAEDLFSYDDSYSDMDNVLQRLASERPHDRQIGRWRAWRALNAENWIELQRLGQKYRKPVWTYIARRHLFAPVVLPENNCLLLVHRLADGEKPSQSCRDREFIAFADWVNNRSLLPNLYEDRFVHEYKMSELLNEAIRENYGNGLPWDTMLAADNEPTLVNLVLTLPEFRFFRQILTDRLQER